MTIVIDIEHTYYSEGGPPSMPASACLSRDLAAHGADPKSLDRLVDISLVLCLPVIIVV
jgi:hypothetical protein